MRWRFWQRQPAGCEHMWSSWSDPVAATVTFRGPWGPTGETIETEAQERRCLTCNLIERRVLR